MAEPLNIALVGGGTVGGGVAKILLEHPERIASSGRAAGSPEAGRRSRSAQAAADDSPGTDLAPTSPRPFTIRTIHVHR